MSLDREKIYYFNGTAYAGKSTMVKRLADPEISVRRFFERPDKEKQFLYQLLLDEKNPEAAIENFRQCLEMINSKENYRRYENGGFNVFVRDENRSIEDTMKLVEKSFGLI